VGIHDIPLCGQWFGSSVALYLELKRLSALHSVKRRDGWTVFSDALFERVGLSNHNTRHTVARRAVRQGWLEVRRSQGARSQYAYRLRPAGTQAGVVDMAAIRNRRKQGSRKQVSP
jgi:hypothetical protein